MAERKPKNIVLRLGARTIECGLEGDSQPLEVFNVHHFAERQNFKADGQTGGNHAQSSSDITANLTDIDRVLNEDISIFNYFFYPDILIFNDIEILKSDMKIHLRKCLTKVFHRCGLSTLNAKVIMIQNQSLSDFYLEIIKDVFLNHFLARALVIVPSSIMISISSASASALIIDIGWHNTSVDVVYDNRVIANYSRKTNRAGCRLHYEFLHLLQQEGFSLKLISFRDVENCITSLESLEMISDGEGEGDEMLLCGTYYVKAILLIRLIKDIFFTPLKLNYEDNELPISQIVAKLVLTTLPIDIRKDIASRIIVTGGMTSIQGFKTQLIRAIKSEVSKDFEIRAIGSLGEWQGASIFSGLMKQMKKKDFLIEYRNSRE